MRRWISVSAYARKARITESAARARAAKYVRLGMWERKNTLKNGHKRVFFRDMNMNFPRHDGSER